MTGGKEGWRDVRCLVTLGSLGQLHLHPVDAVDAVNKENQDEDEGDLQTILELRNDGVFRDEPVVSFVSLPYAY